MTSTRDRQRAAARARLEKEMAERAAAARKRRQLQATVGAGLALLLVVAGTVWLVTKLGDDDTPPPAAAPSASAAPTGCVWTETPADQRSPTTKDVGLPTTTTPPTSGTQVMNLDTNFGKIAVTMDLSKSPCSAAAFSHLASKKFWDGTKCHRMFPGMLQCGDPSAKGKGYRETDGTGGPTFRYANENLPINQRPAYPAGVVALANSGPDTNGSQFFFIYEDVELSPDYTVLGKVTSGLENIKKATAKGHDGAFDPQPGGGHPKNDITIKTLTVTAPQ
ncbi:peptidyl-prolyl cis-trans isomerase B (cyclophilin B) [Micromonospora pattaloongensis]|uniref:Peptidyl-prolyl cis-trans isomerase n=1 Tax=Micromonospora pattaloongensis TaxID=405436 RepID=A0A1H3S4W6_9ACTN|nr:peptidylprolyl isomerase [Micromonospora pattaloongensis]SDZ32982.1 peptidyl-prolyl cis-trans isomerase B (cyclophilin B) [Micromonospora pattaloongensis]